MGEKERGKPDGPSANVTRPHENATPLSSSSSPAVVASAAHTTKGMDYVLHSTPFTYTQPIVKLGENYRMQRPCWVPLEDSKTRIEQGQEPWPPGG